MWSNTWECILLSDVIFYRRLGNKSRERLRAAVTRFVREKDILGIDVEIDDRVRLLVAAAASRLALNLPGETYTRLRFVEVHRTTFGERTDRREGTARLHRVALAFDELEAGLREESDGQNVGYHEFSHVLDASDGVFDGVPPLLVNPTLRRGWVEVLAADLARLRAQVAAGEPTVLSASAAEDEAELFAYATEKFFAAPARLHAAHPDLFALLMAYYRQDPRAAQG